jgi:hypothetical protein
MLFQLLNIENIGGAAVMANKWMLACGNLQNASS